MPAPPCQHLLASSHRERTGKRTEIKGRRGRETVCVVVPEEKMEEDNIGLPKTAMDWLRLTENKDRVKIAQFPDIANAKRVHVLPFQYSMGTFEGDVFDVFLKPYFFENYRPVHAGEVLPVHNKELDMTNRTVDVWNTE